MSFGEPPYRLDQVLPEEQVFCQIFYDILYNFRVAGDCQTQLRQQEARAGMSSLVVVQSSLCYNPFNEMFQ